MIAEVLRRAADNPVLASAGLLHWRYIDDWIVQVPLAVAPGLLDIVEASAARSNLPLQRKKCACHVPALAATAEAEWPPAGRALLEKVPHQPHGLVLLGTEACGDRAMPHPRVQLYAAADAA